MTPPRDCEAPVAQRECAVLVAVPRTEERFRREVADPGRFELAAMQPSWEEYAEAISGTNGILEVATDLGDMVVVWDATLADLRAALARFKAVVLVAHAPFRPIASGDVIDAEAILQEARDPTGTYGIWLQQELARRCPDLLRDGPGARMWRARLEHHLGRMTEEARAPFARAVSAESLGEARANRSLALTRLDIERMFPSAVRAGPAIELADGMHTAWELVRAIPEAFTGTLDLTSCNSVLLLEEIRRTRPECLVASNLLQADLVSRFVYLAYVAEFLAEEPITYGEALHRVREHMARGKKRIVLGGPAPEDRAPRPDVFGPTCPRCHRASSGEGRFCAGCGALLEPGDTRLVRDLRVVAPAVAPRDADFKIHLDIGRAGATLPGTAPGERAAAEVEMAFDARERTPEITVHVRSDLFALGPPTSTIRLDGRAHLRVSFTGRLPPGLRHATGPGEVWIDVLYADEIVAAATFAVDLDSAPDAADAGPRAPARAAHEREIALAQVMELADALEQRTFVAEARGEAAAPERLPEPLAASLRAMIRAGSPFEHAGWIPLVLEAFFRYHLSILGDPPDRSGSPRETLGLLRSRFEAMLSRSRHPARQAFAYLGEYRKKAFLELFNSLVTYRNRVWGHPAVFPTAAQCEQHYATYLPKLERILRVVSEAEDPPWLVATDDAAHPAATTPEPIAGRVPPAPSEPLDAAAVYAANGTGFTPLGDAVRWRACPRGCAGGHFELGVGWEGGRRAYMPAAGSCACTGIEEMLPA